jgi:hypothetical protein
MTSLRNFYGGPGVLLKHIAGIVEFWVLSRAATTARNRNATRDERMNHLFAGFIADKGSS